MLLQSGKPAVWDTFAGLVPVKVLRIVGESSDRPNSSQRVFFRVARNYGPYRCGELHDCSALHVAPRSAIRRRKYSTTIRTYYAVQCSESHNG